MAEVKVNEQKGKVMSNISIDTSMEDMLKYDESGELLVFDSTPGRFMDMPKEIIDELSKANRVRYYMAKRSWELEKKEAENDDGWKNDIVIQEQYASPTERMSIKGADPNLSYYLATPEKMHKHAAKGYSKVAPGAASIGLSGSNTMGTLGNTEYVLMQTTKENKAKIDAAKKEKRDWLMGNVDAGVEQAAADGNIALVRDKD